MFQAGGHLHLLVLQTHPQDKIIHRLQANLHQPKEKDKHIFHQKKKDKKLQILSPSKTCPSKTHKEISQIPEVDTKITTAPAETKLFPDQNSTRIKTPLQLQNMIFKMFSGW